jgi:hypothetical protein
MPTGPTSVGIWMMLPKVAGLPAAFQAATSAALITSSLPANCTPSQSETLLMPKVLSV